MTTANEILITLIRFMFFTLDKLAVLILSLAVRIVYKVPSMKARAAPK